MSCFCLPRVDTSSFNFRSFVARCVEWILLNWGCIVILTFSYNWTSFQTAYKPHFFYSTVTPAGVVLRLTCRQTERRNRMRWRFYGCVRHWQHHWRIVRCRKLQFVLLVFTSRPVNRESCSYILLTFKNRGWTGKFLARSLSKAWIFYELKKDNVMQYTAFCGGWELRPWSMHWD